VLSQQTKKKEEAEIRSIDQNQVIASERIKKKQQKMKARYDKGIKKRKHSK
jgi:hypothetical protein